MTCFNPTQDDRGSSSDSSWLDEVSERPKSASKALQAYIDQFENETTPRETRYNGCYARTAVSSLLSSKPKSASSPRTLKSAAKSSGDMVDNLITWVNASYAKDLHRKIVPYGTGSTSSIEKLRLSELEESDSNDDERSVWSDPGAELSTLPSPGGSMVSDIDSNVESISTDMLLQSFYKKENLKDRKVPVSRDYPSWVENLTTAANYPSWVDDIDGTQVTRNDSFNGTLQNQRRHLSRSLSPSFFRQHTPRSPTSFLSASLQDYPPRNTTKPRTTKSEAWELESTDTEVLISQPMYGRQPVNMGGSLHSSLYRDKKIQQLHEQSSRKLAQRTPRSEMRNESFAKSRTGDETVFPKAKNGRAINLRAVGTVLQRPEIASSIRKNPEPRSNVQRAFNQHGAVLSYESRPKSLKPIKHFKLFLTERKESLGSNNTDKMMRQSPTGIHIVKRESSRPWTPSTKVKNTPKRTPNASQTPRLQASEELTRLIAWADKTPGQLKRVTKRYLNEGDLKKVQYTPQMSRERSLPRTRNGNDSRRNDPMEDDPRVNHPRTFNTTRARSTLRSSPRLRTVSAPDLVAERLRQLSLADRRNGHTPSALHRKNVFLRTPVQYSTKRLNSEERNYEETDSMTTEALVLHPPMPLFDASPSLTTETASIVGSDESENTLLEQQALKTSFLVQDNDLVSSSGTSYMDLPKTQNARETSGRAKPQRSWERNRSYNNTGTQVSFKPGIITSFLEDCMRSSQESHSGEGSTRSNPQEEEEDSLTDVSERPVETLKKMLFTVQGLAQRGEDERSSDQQTISENYETRSETQTEAEEMFSDAISEEMSPGDNSLSRAYYHLARLKKLVSVSEKVAGSLQ